jgi:ferredoxin like protein
MPAEPRPVEDRLSGNHFETDETESHIEVNQQAASEAGAGPLLIRICPAHVYSQRTDGTIGVLYAACLECGACLEVAPAGVLSWHYPRGGKGVAYREG